MKRKCLDELITIQDQLEEKIEGLLEYESISEEEYNQLIYCCDALLGMIYRLEKY